MTPATLAALGHSLAIDLAATEPELLRAMSLNDLQQQVEKELAGLSTLTGKLLSAVRLEASLE